MKTDEQKTVVLSKFTILCWATFTDILGCMRPAGHGLDTLLVFRRQVPGKKDVGGEEGKGNGSGCSVHMLGPLS